jgi:hypothetical protein
MCWVLANEKLLVPFVLMEQTTQLLEKLVGQIHYEEDFTGSISNPDKASYD